MSKCWKWNQKRQLFQQGAHEYHEEEIAGVLNNFVANNQFNKQEVEELKDNLTQCKDWLQFVQWLADNEKIHLSKDNYSKLSKLSKLLETL